MELLDEFQSFIDSLFRAITITRLSAVREKAKFITPVAIMSNPRTSTEFRVLD
jgi:hypothetical protein